MQLWIATGIAAAVLIGIAYVMGHGDGADKERARQIAAQQLLQSQLFEAGERLSRASRQIEELEAQQSLIAQEAEDAARNAPGADRPGIDVNGLRRLEGRWGAN